MAFSARGLFQDVSKKNGALDGTPQELTRFAQNIPPHFFHLGILLQQGKANVCIIFTMACQVDHVRK